MSRGASSLSTTPCRMIRTRMPTPRGSVVSESLSTPVFRPFPTIWASPIMSARMSSPEPRSIDLGRKSRSNATSASRNPPMRRRAGEPAKAVQGAAVLRRSLSIRMSSGIWPFRLSPTAQPVSRRIAAKAASVCPALASDWRSLEFWAVIPIGPGSGDTDRHKVPSSISTEPSQASWGPGFRLPAIVFYRVPAFGRAF